MCRLRQYDKYAVSHLPIRSLDRVSEDEVRMEIGLPNGEYATLSVVFHLLTGELAKAEVRSVFTREIHINVTSILWLLYTAHRLANTA